MLSLPLHHDITFEFQFSLVRDAHFFSDRETRVTREIVELWRRRHTGEQTPETGASGAEQTHQTGAEQPLPIGRGIKSDRNLNDTLSWWRGEIWIVS